MESHLPTFALHVLLHICVISELRCTGTDTTCRSAPLAAYMRGHVHGGDCTVGSETPVLSIVCVQGVKGLQVCLWVLAVPTHLCCV